jgi:hypothetical protein
VAEKESPRSRVHDLFGTFLGLLAMGLLISSRWQVDTSGPDPFYKGPLVFPLMVLSLMLAASLPSVIRLLRPPEGADWRLDGRGVPRAGLQVLALLVLFLAGLVYVGLEASSWLFLFLALRRVGQPSPAVLILLPTAVTLLLYLAFKTFLDIWFPVPLLLELVLE